MTHAIWYPKGNETILVNHIPVIKVTICDHRSKRHREQRSSNIVRKLFNPLQDIPPGALCHKLCHKVCGIGHNLYIQEGKRAAPQAVYQELTVGQKYIAEEKCLRRIEDSRKPAQETLHVTCAVRECRAIKGWDGRSDFRNIHHNRLDTFTCLDLELRF